MTDDAREDREMGDGTAGSAAAGSPARTPWPAIPYAEWEETCTALHLWCQIVGKYRLAHTPWVNHSWHATLYAVPRGLTTGPVHEPLGGCVTLTLDLVDHRLVAEADGGARESFTLEPMSVADFHARAREAVEAVGGTFDIHGAPNELPEAVPFEDDVTPRPYDADAVVRFHGALLRIVPVFERLRTGFLGKVSPVHFFWGSFDLAVTRFSGRRAPPHPGGFPNLPDAVTREAYSHEVASAGFWPGNGGAGEAMFYAYAYPTPKGLGDRTVATETARWDEEKGEFLLSYDAVRQSDDPAGTLVNFLQSTYAVIAEAANWDRDALDCALQVPRVPRPVAGDT